MRIETTTRYLYTAAELQELHPRGFERAREWFYEMEQEDGNREVWDSLHALWDAAGFEHTGYYGYLREGGDSDSTGLTGARALAWFERTLQEPYRIPWTGPKRREVARYGWPYRPGRVEPCPLTGVCYDDDLLNDLKADLVGGMTVLDALRALYANTERIVEEELEYRTEPEQFIEAAECNGWEFTEDGTLA
jgi:hypothetical protein